MKIAAQVAVEPTEVIERVKARRLDRSSQFAVVAASEAWKDAGPRGRRDIDHDRLGVSLATGIGGVNSLLEQLRHPAREGPPPGVAVHGADADAQRSGGQRQPALRRAAAPPTPRCRPARPATKRSSLALDQIRLGRADIVVVGGTEATIHPLPMAAFAQMLALSKNDDDPTTSPARGTSPATASCWARASASWSWSPRSTPRLAARRSTAPSPAPASPPTATTSSSPTPPAAAVRAP